MVKTKFNLGVVREKSLMLLDKRVVKQQKVGFLLLEPKRSERLEAVDDNFANLATAKNSQKGVNIITIH